MIYVVNNISVDPTAAIFSQHQKYFKNHLKTLTSHHVIHILAWLCSQAARLEAQHHRGRGYDIVLN